MELSTPGPNPVPDRLFSIRTRLPLLVLEKRSVTAVPKSMGLDVWRGAAVKWEAARFDGHPAFSFDAERALDGETDPDTEARLAALFTPEEATAVLDLLAAEVPSGTHSLTAVELPVRPDAIPDPHLHKDSSGWGHVTLGGKTSDQWGTLGSLYGSYQLDAGEYDETIDPSKIDTPPPVSTPIRPLSDLEDAVDAAREHATPEPEKEMPF